jgi:hypothetical protein
MIFYNVNIIFLRQTNASISNL